MGFTVGVGVGNALGVRFSKKSDEHNTHGT